MKKNSVFIVLMLSFYSSFALDTDDRFDMLMNKSDSLWFSHSYVQLSAVLDQMHLLAKKNNNVNHEIETLIQMHELEAFYHLDNNAALEFIIQAIDLADQNETNLLRLKTRSKLIYFHQTTSQDENLVLAVLEEMKEINKTIKSEFYTFVNKQWEAQIIGTLRLLNSQVSDNDIRNAVATIRETLTYFNLKDKDEIFYYQQARRCVVGFFPDYFEYDDCLKYIEEIHSLSHRLKDPINQASNRVFEGTFYALIGQNEKVIEVMTENRSDIQNANHGISKFYYQILLSAYEQTRNYRNALESAKKMHFHDQEVNQLAFANQLETIKALKETDEVQLKNELLQLRNYLFYGISFLLSSGLFLIFVAYRKIKKQNVVIHSQKENLEELNQAKTKLFALLSHDLRGPIASLTDVSQNIHFLSQKKDWNTLDKMTEQIKSKTQNAQNMLENILPWMSAQIKNPQANIEEVNIKSLVDQILFEIQDRLSNKEVEIENSIEENCQIEIDRASFKLVLLNIIGNAIKFTHKGGMIKIYSLKNQDGETVVSISDNGIGIGEKQLKTIFTNYNSTIGTSGEKGNGIGLKLCKDLMISMNGNISLESTLGQGTTVNITC